MARNTRQARARARTRRIELDRDRAARDRKVEDAAAAVFVLLEQRAQARRAVHTVEKQIGKVLHSLITDDGLSLQEAAAYCDLPRPDGRRLVRLAQPAPGPAAAAEAETATPPTAPT